MTMHESNWISNHHSCFDGNLACQTTIIPWHSLPYLVFTQQTTQALRHTNGGAASWQLLESTSLWTVFHLVYVPTVFRYSQVYLLTNIVLILGLLVHSCYILISNSLCVDPVIKYAYPLERLVVMIASMAMGNRRVTLMPVKCHIVCFDIDLNHAITKCKQCT